MEGPLQTITTMQSLRYALLVVFGLAACRDASGKEDVRLRPVLVTLAANAPKLVEDFGLPDDKPPDPEDLAAKRAERDKKKGDQNDSEWVKVHALNVLDELGPKAAPVRAAIEALKSDKGEYVKRLVEHALSR